MFYTTLIQKYRDTLISKITHMERILADAPDGNLKIERHGN